MGKGGRAAGSIPGGNQLAAVQHVLDRSPLSDRPTAELKKHAEQRGLKSDGTREDLLFVLQPFSKVRTAGIILSRAQLEASP